MVLSKLLAMPLPHELLKLMTAENNDSKTPLNMSVFMIAIYFFFRKSIGRR